MRERTRHRPWSRIPSVVLAASVAFGALGALWSVAVPLFEAPDESTHLALVLHLAEGKPYPDYDGLRSPASTFRGCATYSASIRTCPEPGEAPTAELRLHPAAEAPDKATRPAWDDLNGAAPVGRINQMPQHPPLYYQAMATVLRVERFANGGPASLDRELALLRLVNVLLVAPLPILAWWAARRFGLDDPTSVAASLAVFGVPMLTHIGASLNNDNLLTLCGAVLVALLAGVVRGDRTRRTALAVGAVTGLALLTKAFAVLFPPLVAVAYLLGRRQVWPAAADVDVVAPTDGAGGDDAGAGAAAPVGWRATVRAVGGPVAVAGLVTVVVAAWWYVGLRLRTGTFVPSVEDQVLNASLQPPGFVPDRWFFATRYLWLMDTRFWGSFGWYTIRLPGRQTQLLTTLVAACVASAVATRRVPGAVGRSPSRLAVAFLLLPALALFGFVTVRAWSLYELTSRYPFIQGRYLFAGIVGLAVVVAVGVQRVAGRWTPFVVVAGAGLVQADALRRVLAGYWGGPGLGPRGELRALVAWSGWPGEVVALFAGLAAVAAAWLAWELLRLARTPADPEAGAGRPVGSIAP